MARSEASSLGKVNQGHSTGIDVTITASTALIHHRDRAPIIPPHRRADTDRDAALLAVPERTP